MARRSEIFAAGPSVASLVAADGAAVPGTPPGAEEALLALQRRLEGLERQVSEQLMRDELRGRFDDLCDAIQLGPIHQQHDSSIIQLENATLT